MSIPAGERLARLSREATLCAAALTGRVGPDVDSPNGPNGPDRARLAAVLYSAGGAHPAEGMDERWPTLLVRRAERPVRAALVDHTRSVTAAWFSWTHRDADPTHLVHKVYVSPALSDLAESLTVTFALAAAHGIPAWKVGADVHGIHRPDKIVLYLPSEEAADRAASTLAEALSHAAPQGVPFTGQVGASGIVSRGRDHDGTSWRALVCRSLADALLAARSLAGSTAAPTDVADLALAHLAHLGFDVARWHPRREPIEVGR